MGPYRTDPVKKHRPKRVLVRVAKVLCSPIWVITALFGLLMVPMVEYIRHGPGWPDINCDHFQWLFRFWEESDDQE
jgi:hypothetical protein